MKYKILLFVSILVLSLTNSITANSGVTSQGEESHAQHYTEEDLKSGEIATYRKNYVPHTYFPTPEYMVFVDLGILILLIAVGIYFVYYRKSQRTMTVLAIITFAYLGFIRGGCICPVGVVSNTAMGLLNPEMIGLATLIVFLVPLIAAFFIGRVFCSSGCPLGTAQHIAPEKKKHFKLPQKLNNYLRIVPVVILIGTIYYALKNTSFFACELDPYKAVFFTGQSWFEQLWAYIAGRSMEAKFVFAMGIGTWIYLVAILILGYWVPRPFCRFICPYGVLLGVVSIFSLKPRRISDENCVHCGMCQRSCPTQAIVIDRKNKYTSLSNYDCIQCNRCNSSCNKNAIG